MNKQLVDLIKKHEGFRATIYLCSAGKHTIGYGHNCDAHGDLDAYKDRVISPAEADDILLTDLNDVILDCTKFVRTFDILDEPRKAVIVDMAFNLGIDGLLKFRNFLGYTVIGNWKRAASEMYNSKWFTQVPLRAAENMFMFLTGEYL